MIKIEDQFRYKGVDFEVVKRGEKAILLTASADFYTCKSIEVWQIRHSKDVTIKGNFVPAREKKPSNENYPYTAHQFMRNHFQTEEAFQYAALKRFNEYEEGIRPKKVAV